MKVNLIKDQNSFQITCKAVNEIVEDDIVKGIEIEGYASTKDKDRVKDIVEPTAFKNALDLYMTNPIVLLQHNADKPIGIVESATIDSKGLYIKAKITEDTDGVFSKLKNKVLRAFSIGYRVKDFEVAEVKDDQGDISGEEYIIKDLELFEISLVSIPANPYALTKSFSNCFELVKEEEIEEDKVSEVMDHEIAETEEENKEEEATEEEKVEETTESEEAPVEEEKEEEEVVVKEEENNEEIVDSTESENSQTEEEVVNEEVVEEEKEIEPEANSEIESNEETDDSGNVSESETESLAEESETIEKAVDLKELSRKGIEAFMDRKSQAMKKELEDKLAEKDAKISDLSEKLGLTQELLKECVNVLVDLDSAVKNTVIKTGYSYYERPAKKANGYSKIVSLAKSI